MATYRDVYEQRVRDGLTTPKKQDQNQSTMKIEGLDKPLPAPKPRMTPDDQDMIKPVVPPSQLMIDKKNDLQKA